MPAPAAGPRGRNGASEAVPRRRGGHGNGLDAWPGYVDALSTLLLVVIFVLLVFVLGQAFLSVALSGRQHALERLTTELAQLSNMLSLEKRRDAALQVELGQVDATLAAKNEDLARARTLSAAEASSVSLLNAQIAALRQQLAAIAQALDVSQTALKDRDVHIADLDRKLNLALADRVEQLKKYQSEFFARLSQVLAGEKGGSVVGDRFVFQSEVLFPVGSATLSPAGAKQIRALATTLKQVAARIPPGIAWILRVDGHADRQRAKGATDALNWTLSADRGISVVRLLIEQGGPPQHVAAAGFGEYQPLDPANTEAAYAKNRRIELRLTDR